MRGDVFSCAAYEPFNTLYIYRAWHVSLPLAHKHGCKFMHFLPNFSRYYKLRCGPGSLEPGRVVILSSSTADLTGDSLSNKLLRGSPNSDHSGLHDPPNAVICLLQSGSISIEHQPEACGSS
jgi:hypothetical protein